MKPNETFIQDPFAYGDYGNGIGSSLKALSGSALGWLGNKFMGTTTTEQKQRESANGTAQPYPIQNIKEAFEQRPNTIQMIPLPKTNITQALPIINKPQKIHTDQTAGIRMGPSDLSRFSNGKTATPQNALDMYGKVPGSAIIRDAKTGKVLVKGLGEATGGFARPSTWKENLAFEDEQLRQSREIADRRTALDFQTSLESLMHRASTGDKNALATLAASNNIKTPEFSKQGALDIERSQVPYRNKLNEAQAKHYAGLNETTVGGQRLKALADILEAKLKGNKTGALTLDQRIKLEEMKLTNPEGYAALAKEYGITG